MPNVKLLDYHFANLFILLPSEMYFTAGISLVERVMTGRKDKSDKEFKHN